VSRYAELKSTADNALVLGYGAVTEAQIEEGLEKLTTMVRNST
jgi:DNA-binding transcriptional MocR family regulator